LVNLEVTNLLKGDLGELYFKHLCLQRSFAYVRLEDIYNGFTPSDILEFKYGFDRIQIEIPSDIVEEVRRISKPLKLNNNSSFVFDFLTCRLGSPFFPGVVNRRESGHFYWVDVKTGGSPISSRKIEALKNCRIKSAIFRISDVTIAPEEVDIRIDTDVVPYV
jgi:hypothetical protein